MSNKLKAPAVRKIKAGWLAGASLYDLAAEHDVGPKAIWYHVKDLKRDNAPPRGPRRSLDYAKIAKLRDEGFRAVEIAERFSVSRFHVWRVLRSIRAEAARAAA
jgi:biotin operon repressor